MAGVYCGSMPVLLPSWWSALVQVFLWAIGLIKKLPGNFLFLRGCYLC